MSFENTDSINDRPASLNLSENEENFFFYNREDDRNILPDISSLYNSPQRESIAEMFIPDIGDGRGGNYNDPGEEMLLGGEEEKDKNKDYNANNVEDYSPEDRTGVTNIKLSFLTKDLPQKDNALVCPSFCPMNTIKEMINKNEDNKNTNEIINKIIDDESVRKAEEYMENIPRDDTFVSNDNHLKQENSNDLKMEQKDNKLKKKRGRKTDKNNDAGHDRYKADNIIKKIKAKIFGYSLDFINKMILEKGIQLLKIDYKYTDQLKRKDNLALFKMTLKDLFSQKISPKNKKKEEDFNEKIINKIQQQFGNDDTIMFLFSISLNDYIDLFTYKKDIRTLVNEYNAVKVNYDKIKENFKGAKHLLNENNFINEKDNKYYTLFLLYIFNFQRWFFIKKERNTKRK